MTNTQYFTSERWIKDFSDDPEKTVRKLRSWSLKGCKDLIEILEKGKTDKRTPERIMNLGTWLYAPQEENFWSNYYNSAYGAKGFDINDGNVLRELKRNIIIMETGIDPGFEVLEPSVPDYLLKIGERDDDI
jgi:hypothetical protein